MIESGKVSRRSTLKGVGGASLAIGLAGCFGNGNENGNSNGNNNANGDGEREEVNLTMGTAAEDTGAYTISQAIAAVVNNNSDWLRINAIPTAGSKQSPRLLDQGEIDIGYSNRANLFKIHNDMDEYEEDSFENNLQHLFFYYSIQMGVIGLEPPITNLSDIEGQRGSPQPEGASSRTALTRHMQYGVDFDNVPITSVSFGNLAQQLSSENIKWCGEVRINLDIVPSYMQQLWNTVDDAAIVHFPEDIVEQARDDSLNAGRILSADDLGEYARFAGDHDEAYFPEILYDAVCRDDLDDDIVREFVSTLAENSDQMEEYGSLAAYFSADWMADLNTNEYPVHPAVEEYYAEIGAGEF
jgi:TRAP-type uncharacterized transport system substrate-binding protein